MTTIEQLPTFELPAGAGLRDLDLDQLEPVLRRLSLCRPAMRCEGRCAGNCPVALAPAAS